MFGFLNIYKPKGLTSHDVVARLRRVSKFKQIGHTGTLDPLAEGVLPIAFGKATRLIEYLKEDKAYIAELEFGKVSDTYDTEGVVEKFSDKKVVKEQLIQALTFFEGEIEQIPPAYSAVHYNGKRLYELAREGIIPDDIPKRKVVINKIQLIDFNESLQTAKIEIACSKGTYIRSIVNDLGQNLGSGAVMTALTRTKSGLFTLDNSVQLDSISDADVVKSFLINPVDVLSYHQYELSEEQMDKVQHGQSLLCELFEQDEFVCLVFKNNLCALAQKQIDKLVTKKVFI